MHESRLKRNSDPLEDSKAALPFNQNHGTIRA